MGLNLGFIGKKLQDYEGDVGRFFGSAAQGAGQAAQTLGNVANATSRVVGGGVNYGVSHPLEVAKATPVLGDAIRFGQQSATPQFQQQNLGQQVGQFTGGILHEGFDPLIRTGGRIAATLTNHPQVSLAGTSLPVSQEIGQAQPIAGSKLLGQAATGLGIIGDATAYAGGLHLPTEGVRLPAPSIVNRAQVALKKAGRNAQDTLSQEQGGVAIMHPWDQHQEAINQTQDQIANLKADIGARQTAAQEAHRQIDANPMIKTTAKDAMHRRADELAARDVRLKQEELAGWMDHLGRLSPEAKPAATTALAAEGVPLDQRMSYDPVPTTTQKVLAHVKQTLTGEAGQRGSHNMFEPVNAPEGKLSVAQKQGNAEAAQFLGIDPKGPTSAETFAAHTEPLTVEKVATAAARAKEVAKADTQKAIDRVQSAQFNPVKIKTAEVKPGDYPQAIARAAQLSQPVDVARSQWESSMRRLQKESPNEYKNFWNAVETPTDSAHSPLLKEAITRWRAGADRAHAGSVVLGKNVGYMQDYARHPWDLSGWKEAEGATGGTPFTTKERVHRTIAEGEAAGLKQKGDPLGEGRAYFKAAQSTLHKDALIHGLEKADVGQQIKPHTLDLGYGKTVQLSDEGRAAAKGTEFSTGSKNPVVRGVRQTQGVIKGTLLSLSQFHPVNIAVLRAAPALVAKGHFVEAAKGVYGTFRGAFGNDYAEHVIGQALKDGTVEKAAQIGMPFGSSEYHGFNMKRGLGEQTVFNKQMPMMHNQVVRSIIDDLDKRGIPLDSPEARAAGKAGNNLMGFVNDEMQRISPRTRQAMSDWLLAGQFTPAKFGNLRDSFRGGQGGSYARAAVAGNVAALTALSLGLGWVAKQKSDNIKDLFLRSLVDPAVPTSMQDQKGNTIKLRLPGSNVSDVAKLAGVTLTRGKDGHLGVNWSPSNMPSTVEDWMRARLGPLSSAAVKLKTNTTFAGKPLYDPNAKLGTQAQQAATSLVVGDLPIGTQGLAYTGTVKNHTPKDIKAVLDAQTPGTNPVLKSLGASFGLTPATDTTVGKGRDNATYFGALTEAKKGLNRQAQDALDLYTGSKKNPVTGAYDVQPNVNDQKAKAAALLQNPDALGKLVSMNKTLSEQGQKVDPLWTASPEQITKYLQYQTMRPNGPDQQNWRATNPWYADMQKSRSTFFDSLPPGDPNKPHTPIEYPQAPPEVQAKLDTYFSLPEGKQRAVFIDQNPDVAGQFKAQTDYYTKLSTAQGYAKTKDYPEASPDIKQALDAGNYAAPGVRDYLAKISEYNVIKGGTQAQFEGTDLSQSALKGIYSLGNYDISKTSQPDGTNKYALDPSAGQSKSASFSHPYRPNPTRHAQIGKGKRLKGGSSKVSLRGIKKISVKRKLV